MKYNIFFFARQVLIAVKPPGIDLLFWVCGIGAGRHLRKAFRDTHKPVRGARLPLPAADGL